MVRKKTVLIILVLLLSYLLLGCTQKSQITLEDVTKKFEAHGLLLKPQLIQDYPDIQGVKPHVFELMDDTVFIYVFNTPTDSKKEDQEIKVEFLGEPITYRVKNILLIYLRNVEANPEVSIENKVSTIIEELSLIK